MHYSTVSLAMRDHPRLSRETCARIQELARKLGYVPDPMLASLASYRHSLRPTAYNSTLGWVTAFPGRNDWRKIDIFKEQHAGATQRAGELGYRLEDFWLSEPGMTAARASQILSTRNLTGLIIAPLPKAGGTLRLHWQHFSAVAIGYSLGSPALHLVSANQYRCIRLALHELTRRGYRRIGLVMLKASDDRVDHNWLAGYLVERHESPEPTWLPPLVLEAWDQRRFSAWIRREKPEAIVTKLPQVLPALRSLGLAVPGEVGLACLSDTHPGDEHTGVDENPRQVGAAAVDFVVGMLHRNERGVPALRYRLLIDGAWIEGVTVRPRPAEIAASTS